jgi:arylsulfatase A-like enzyme
MPTILDYLGIDNPQADKLPGQSYTPILRGEQIKEKDIVVIYDEYGPVRMVRSKEWKYVHRYPYGPNELYHLETDIDERVNLIDQPDYNDVIASMKALLENWFLKYVDPEVDGTREPVTGFGQLRLAGNKSQGMENYKSHMSVSNKLLHKNL